MDIPKWESVKYELGDEYNTNFKNPTFEESSAKPEIQNLDNIANILKVCRCCMQNNDLKPIFNSRNPQSCLAEMIKACAGIELTFDDFLPKNICNICEKKFEYAFELRNQTRKSDEVLRNLLFKYHSEYNTDLTIDDETSRDNQINTTNNPSADSGDVHSIFLPEVVIKDEISDDLVDFDIALPVDQPSEDVEAPSKDVKVVPKEEPRRVTRNSRQARKEKARVKVKLEQKKKDDNAEETPTVSEPEAETSVSETKEEKIDDEDEEDESDDGEKPKEKTRRRPARKKEKVQSADTINRIMCEVSQSLVCHYCGKSTFTQPNRLKKHIYEYHSDTVFSCDICNKIFKSGNNLQRHKKLVHEKFRFKCDQCNCDFYTTSDLKRHKLDEHSDAEAKHQCDLCGKMFKHVILLETHRKWHVYHSRKPNYNPENREKFRDRRKDARPRCEACSIDKFTNKDDFKQHHENHNGKYDCQICGKSFKTDNKLRLHKYINHSGKVYYCDKCEYKTTNPSNVQSHRRIHNENRHFECDICKKKTTTRLRMKIHRRIHTGEKPYCCAFCGKSFSDPSTFRKHKKRHEPPKDQLPKPTTTTIDHPISDIDMVHDQDRQQQQQEQQQQQQQQLIFPLPDRITLPLPLVQQLMPPLPEGIPYFT